MVSRSTRSLELMNSSIVMRHPQKPPQVFRLGFSLGAFFLGPLWAIYRRLWLVMVVMVLTSLPIVFLDEYSRAMRNRTLLLVVLALYIAYMVVCGLFGNRWRRWTLEKRGYVLEAKA